jgi:steroid delta-isomerase-like uncharacterized protein
MSEPNQQELPMQLLAAWNARDLDAFTALLAEDVEWYDPAMPAPPARGRAQVREFAESMLAAFPDFQYDIEPPICYAPDGSRCAIVWRITATHMNALAPLGLAPTGRTARFEGVDVLDMRKGRISRIRTAFDPLPAAEQLLNLKLRPLPGTWRAAFAVGVQRLLAWLARIRS